MKAIIMIAGEGTRLKPLTNYIPKCCMPIAGVPLLHIWIKNLMAAHVKDILLNPCHGIKYVQKSVMSGIPIPTITIRPECKPLGTAQTILRNTDWIGDDDFFIIYGDVLTNLNVWRLSKTHMIHREQSVLTVAAYETSKPRQKGILDVKNGWAYKFEEKPTNPTSNLAFAGVAVAGNSFLEHIKSSDIDIGHDVLPRLVNPEKPRVFAYHDSSLYYKDIGTIPDYLACQSEWRQLNG